MNRVRVIVFNVTFNNILVTSISCRSIISAKETGEATDLAQGTAKLSVP